MLDSAMIHFAGGNSLKSCVVLVDGWWLLEVGVVFKGFGVVVGLLLLSCVGGCVGL